MLAAARLAGLVVQENVVGRGTNPSSPKDTGAGAVGGKRVKGGSFSVIRTLEGIRGPTQV
jgi:hypothetical protein